MKTVVAGCTETSIPSITPRTTHHSNEDTIPNIKINCIVNKTIKSKQLKMAQEKFVVYLKSWRLSKKRVNNNNEFQLNQVESMAR
jgi:hypothetical protein